EVIVHWRRRALRHDERKETQRAVLGTIERVLTDASAHPAGFVGLRARCRQPAIGGQQRSKGRAERLDARRIVVDGRPQSMRLVDEPSDFRSVHQKTVRLVLMGVVEIAHGKQDTSDEGGRHGHQYRTIRNSARAIQCAWGPTPRRSYSRLRARSGSRLLSPNDTGCDWLSPN